jgi:hypothetical protein
MSVGWPSRIGIALRSWHKGERWYSGADGTPRVFISPTLDDPLAVGATLVHQLMHAALGSGGAMDRPSAVWHSA